VDNSISAVIFELENNCGVAHLSVALRMTLGPPVGAILPPVCHLSQHYPPRTRKRPVIVERRFSSPHLHLLQSLLCAVKLSEVVAVEIAELGVASSLSLVSESPSASHDSCAVPLLTSPFSSLTRRTSTPVASCCRRSRRCSAACACRQQPWPL
jgi:hypothetical protein